MKRFKKEEVQGVCPICEGGDLQIYRHAEVDRAHASHSITKASYGIPGTLLRCLRCGIIFVHPLLPERMLKSLYEDMKDEAYLEEEETRRKMAERSLCFIEKYTRKGRLLDVGCFSGFFLDVANSRGWEGIGIEPSSWARSIAKERFGLQILGGTLEEASFPSSSFEVVTFIDTLEHLRDPKGALSETCRILKTGGILYLSTPNVRSLAARLLGNGWWGFRQEHLVYFSKQSLFYLLDTLGFVILSQRSYCRLFTVSAIIRRLKEMNSLFYRVIQPLGQIPSIGGQRLIVNFFDQIELLARKG